MHKAIYFTRNLQIEVLPNNTVKLTNSRENGKIYLLDSKRFYQLLKVGGKKWKIPYKNGSYEEISFNIANHSAGKHISSAGGGINTYIALHDYRLLMLDLEASIGLTALERNLI